MMDAGKCSAVKWQWCSGVDAMLCKDREGGAVDGNGQEVVSSGDATAGNGQAVVSSSNAEIRDGGAKVRNGGVRPAGGDELVRNALAAADRDTVKDADVRSRLRSSLGRMSGAAGNILSEKNKEARQQPSQTLGIGLGSMLSEVSDHFLLCGVCLHTAGVSGRMQA